MSIGIYDIMFYLFAAVTLVSGLLVVTTRNVVHAGFYLLFTFFGVTGIYVLLGADFVAITQLLVYVGGILVLLLFGVMLTNKITNVDIKTGTLHIIPAVLVLGLFAAIVTMVMLSTNWNVASVNTFVTTKELGSSLITNYVLIFELLGILLLIALIGAASIARRGRE